MAEESATQSGGLLPTSRALVSLGGAGSSKARKSRGFGLDARNVVVGWCAPVRGAMRAAAAADARWELCAGGRGGVEYELLFVLDGLRWNPWSTRRACTTSENSLHEMGGRLGLRLLRYSNESDLATSAGSVALFVVRNGEVPRSESAGGLKARVIDSGELTWSSYPDFVFVVMEISPLIRAWQRRNGPCERLLANGFPTPAFTYDPQHSLDIPGNRLRRFGLAVHELSRTSGAACSRVDQGAVVVGSDGLNGVRNSGYLGEKE
ncbi:hypothetical protein DFP72DRAFT_842722 [Ephemerocybe angulata]|uniref:Uncharacterized protein n=1 Tax=Ephemerocybe angulata TaxID=980116 RepID=A0A8H6I8W7_9AGAR|nr:hypothetical protein DFP72DRAFT_842722 [Tulosesus angulatus]